MRVFLLLTIVALGACGLWLYLWTVEYRGSRILLSSPLLDIDSFKNAERKLSASQAKKVERLLVTAPVAAEYESLEAMIDGIHALCFPGYGTHSIPAKAPDGGAAFLTCVEIPESGNDRCLLFRRVGDRVEMLDDVVVSSLVGGVRLGENRPIYLDRGGAELAAHRAPSVAGQAL